MDVQLLAGIERICSLPEHQLEVELGKLLEGRAPMATITIRAARDSFTKLLARARDGSVQLVGKDKGEQTVILSVAALANVIKAAAGGISAGEFLAATQFQPSAAASPMCRVASLRTNSRSCTRNQSSGVSKRWPLRKRASQ